MARKERMSKPGSSPAQVAGRSSSAAVVLLAAVATGGWLWWRQRKHGGRTKAAGAARAGTLKQASQAGAASAAPAAPVLLRHPSELGRASRKGANPKKNPKAKRKLQSAPQEAAPNANTRLLPHGVSKGLELVHNASIKDKEKAKEEEEPQSIKYVDLTKTDEVYDKVRRYQETGKKTF